MNLTQLHNNTIRDGAQREGVYTYTHTRGRAETGYVNTGVLHFVRTYIYIHTPRDNDKHNSCNSLHRGKCLHKLSNHTLHLDTE